jgi:hypothetical protein
MINIRMKKKYQNKCSYLSVESFAKLLNVESICESTTILYSFAPSGLIGCCASSSPGLASRAAIGHPFGMVDSLLIPMLSFPYQGLASLAIISSSLRD